MSISTVLRENFLKSVLEETFEGGAHQIHHEHVVVSCIKIMVPSVEQ
jgi:hypothetical protein